MLPTQVESIVQVLWDNLDGLDGQALRTKVKVSNILQDVERVAEDCSSDVSSKLKLNERVEKLEWNSIIK